MTQDLFRQSDQCKLNVAERQIAELEEIISIAEKLDSDEEVSSQRVPHRLWSIVAGNRASMKRMSASIADLQKALRSTDQATATVCRERNGLVNKVADLERQLSERAQSPFPRDASCLFVTDLGDVTFRFAFDTFTVVPDEPERWVGVVEEACRQRDGWMETARLHCKNEEFYRNIVIHCGEVFGDEAKTADDGTVQEDVLALKVVELVQRLHDKHHKTSEQLAEALKELEKTANNRREAWDRHGEMCRLNVTLETRLEHAMALLHKMSTEWDKGFVSFNLFEQAKELHKKYVESPLHVPNPQSELLAAAMELLREIQLRMYVPLDTYGLLTPVKQLLAKHAKKGGGDDE